MTTSPPNAMTAVRSKEALADALKDQLEETRGRLTMRCESHDEAILLAHELRARGWKAVAEMAMIWRAGTDGQPPAMLRVPACAVNGKSKARRKT